MPRTRTANYSTTLTTARVVDAARNPEVSDALQLGWNLDDAVFETQGHYGCGHFRAKGVAGDIGCMQFEVNNPRGAILYNISELFGTAPEVLVWTQRVPLTAVELFDRVVVPHEISVGRPSQSIVTIGHIIAATQNAHQGAFRADAREGAQGWYLNDGTVFIATGGSSFTQVVMSIGWREPGKQL